MGLIKTSLLNGIAVVVKMLTLLGINKVLAVYVGPSGYAAIGQFQNAVQMITTLASGAINTGVTKYTAEYHYSEQKQRAVWRTAGTMAIIGSLLTGALLIAFSRPIAIWVFNTESLSSVFYWVAIALVFQVFNSLLLAILNGKKNIRKYVIANISGSIFSLIIITILTFYGELYGALVGLAIYQALAFWVTLFICFKEDWFKKDFLVGKLNKYIAVDLSKYMLMALTSAICVPVSHMLIRNHLGSTLGWEAAGYWEAMWRLSTAYLILVTSTLSIYYLPRLSELTNPEDVRREIILGYKIILPFAIFCGFLIYVFRDFIVSILFSNDFYPIRDLFAWQMIGDTLKTASWILGYLLAAKAMVKAFLLTEIFFSLFFYLLIYWGTDFIGLNFVSVAHAINYGVHLVVMFFIVKRLKII